MKITPVIIVGGGLSGLCTAYRLQQNAIPFVLLEARERLGGRILATDDSRIDLGPSWFWPGQRQIATLLEELGLQDSVYPQASEGLSVMEYADGSLQKSLGGASMAGSNRLDGGMPSLIESLARHLPVDSLQTSSVVTHIEQVKDKVNVSVSSPDQATEVIQGRHIVLALPPRLVGRAIQFQPGLPSKDSQRLAQIPTWMAGQAKFIAEYSTPFWQSQGLSGDGFSQLGPLGEIHDASPRRGSSHALFGFIGLTPEQRKGQDVAVQQAAVQQLSRMFGDAASQPLAVHLKDWAFDEHTATALDLDAAVPRGHGRAVLNSEWDKRLVWAGSETAGLVDHSSGYLEGAVEAGNRAAALLVTLLTQAD